MTHACAQSVSLYGSCAGGLLIMINRPEKPPLSCLSDKQ